MADPTLELELDGSCVWSLFTGLELSYLLCGITCAQTMFYFYNYQNDTRAVRSLVAVIWLLDTAKVITEVHQSWHYFVFARGNISALLQADPFFGGEQLIKGILIVTVQWYFLQKIHSLLSLKTRYSMITFIIPSVMLLLLSSGSYLWTSYNCFFSSKSAQFYGVDIAKDLDAVVFVYAVSLITDTYITCMLCYALQHSRTGFRSTEHIIMKLFNYILSRGILLCVISAALLVIYCLDARYSTCYTEILQASSATLYANSLLVMLNIRNHVKQHTINEPESLSFLLRVVRTTWCVII
ncbi:uncharacterized protein B0H18DRAFT_685107 [Fomitopsis serialis]|uniref:uncharacterized protein n=1 Tax=Fomitopsis serialis TaxID=139415 RepID=UPI00200868FD|nr:uncharacterized protein B0H18DRAFT_685107 [Neoantrodia serialis]KAH9917956.1 hypothetical protein B0H18DRAFT_685107 [Neoantrodia serialis]